MHRLLLLLLSLPALFFANTALTENDPASIVSGVSVITGDFYFYDEAFRVEGTEACSLKLHYMKGSWGFLNHHTCELAVKEGEITIAEENGTIIKYRNTGWLNRLKKREKNRKKYPGTTDDCPEFFRFHAYAFQETPGVANTARGYISGQTDLRTQYLDLHVTTDGFILHASDGTLRDYHREETQEDFKLGKTEKYFYQLRAEELPNGNKIHYKRRWDHWNKKDMRREFQRSGYKPNSIGEIRTSNRNDTKTYSRVEFPYTYSDISFHKGVASGSDDRRARLTFFSEQQMVKIDSPDHPEQEFLHTDKKLYRINHKPNLRSMEILYYANDKVKAIAVPAIDSPNTFVNLYQFHYDFNERTTRVLDAYLNPVIYRWDENLRLKQIEHYTDQKLYHTERFVWDGSRIRCKSIHDSCGAPISARTFAYDDKGNVKEEILWGNISGQIVSLQIGEDGLPQDNGIEKSITRKILGRLSRAPS